MSDPSEQLAREDFPEATVIRVRSRTLSGDDRSTAIECVLFRLVEEDKGRIIVDLTEVEYLGSAAIGMLMTLRRRLMANGKSFQPPCRRRGLFACFPDRAAAIEAIRQGEADPLLLCGVSPQNMEVFEVCG